MRVLVVEDQANVSTYIKRALEEQGYAVDVARTGREALGWANVVDFDIIVLDIMLPDVSGLVMCRQLRANQQTAHLPIIMISAHMPPKTEEAKAAGASAYLAKPINLRSLKETLINVGINP